MKQAALWLPLQRLVLSIPGSGVGGRGSAGVRHREMFQHMVWGLPLPLLPVHWHLCQQQKWNTECPLGALSLVSPLRALSLGTLIASSSSRPISPISPAPSFHYGDAHFCILEEKRKEG